MLLNMFENPVNVEVAFYQFSFNFDNGKWHFKSSPRTFWTDLVKLNHLFFISDQSIIHVYSELSSYFSHMDTGTNLYITLITISHIPPYTYAIDHYL